MFNQQYLLKIENDLTGRAVVVVVVVVGRVVVVVVVVVVILSGMCTQSPLSGNLLHSRVSGQSNPNLQTYYLAIT